MSNNPSLININNLNINENNKNTITINDSIYLHDAIIIYPYVYNNVHYDFIYDSNNDIEYDKDGLAKISATITDGVSDIIIKDNITYYDKDSNKKLIGVVSVVNITLTTNTQYIYINNSAENVNINASSNILSNLKNNNIVLSIPNKVINYNIPLIDTTNNKYLTFEYVILRDYCNQMSINLNNILLNKLINLSCVPKSYIYAHTDYELYNIENVKDLINNEHYEYYIQCEKILIDNNYNFVSYIGLVACTIL